MKSYVFDVSKGEKKNNYEKSTCSKCKSDGIGEVKGEYFRVGFCAEHEEEALKIYHTHLEPKDNKAIEEGKRSAWFKLVYYDPQPIPPLLKMELDRLGMSNIHLFSVDRKSIESIVDYMRTIKKPENIQYGEDMEINVSSAEEN